MRKERAGGGGALNATPSKLLLPVFPLAREAASFGLRFLETDLVVVLG